MMINYRNLAGGEVSYWNGIIYFWMADGVYTVKASTVQRHRCNCDSREITLSFIDTENNFKKCVSVPCKGLDDFELIYRFISGSASCDCIRGEIIYGTDLQFPCNDGPNRFVLRKMAIKGEDSNCILQYKGYV